MRCSMGWSYKGMGRSPRPCRYNHDVESLSICDTGIAPLPIASSSSRAYPHLHAEAVDLHYDDIACGL